MERPRHSKPRHQPRSWAPQRGLRPASGPLRPDRVPWPRRLAAALLLAVLLAPLLSGCLLGPKIVYKQRPPAKPPTLGDLTVSLQAERGGLGAEFTHYWITVAYVHLYQATGYREPVELKLSNHTVDLIAAADNDTRLPIFSGRVPSMQYQGWSMYVNKVEAERMKRVGFRDGEAILEPERISIRPNTLPLQIPGAFPVYADAAGEFSLMVHLGRSFVVPADGDLLHETAIHYSEFYVNGRKVSERLHLKLPGDTDVDGTPRGDAIRREQQEQRSRHDPVARAVVRTLTGEILFRSGYTGVDRRAEVAAHPLETVFFDSSSSSDVDRGGSIKSASWDFHDGHRWNGGSVEHVFGTGGIYEVLLAVNDDNLGFDQQVVSLFVDFLPSQARHNETRNVGGRLLVGASGHLEDGRGLATANHTFGFPESVGVGLWRLGGYRVRLDYDGTASTMDLRLRTLNDTDPRQGHRRLDVRTNHTGDAPLELLARGGPYTWGNLEVVAMLKQGAPVEYKLGVTAIYLPDVYTGFDGHSHHFHDSWAGFIDMRRFGIDNLVPEASAPSP